MTNQQPNESTSSQKGGNVIHNQDKSGQQGQQSQNKSGSQGQHSSQSSDKRNDPKQDSTRKMEAEPDRARDAADPQTGK